jgi:hypothetical protein
MPTNVVNIRIQVLLMSVALAFSAFLSGINARGQNLYVSDYGYIAQFTPTGLGTAVASESELGTDGPLGIAFNNSGELFVCAYTNILEINTNGAVSVFANGLTGTNPIALAFNSSGTLFASTYNSYTGIGYIIRFNSDGSRTTFASDLSNPIGLAFDSAGNLFEADAYSDTIYKFTPTGVQSTFASGLNVPEGLAFNSSGNLFEADFESGNIYEFTPSGAKSTFASGLNYPIGLAFNSSGDLFVGQDGAGSVTYIMEITPAGITNSFGPKIVDPWGLAFYPTPPNLKAASLARQVQVSVSMPSPYYSTVIQASTNLINWVSVYTNTPAFIYTDSITSFSRRFYRATLIQ